MPVLMYCQTLLETHSLEKYHNIEYIKILIITEMSVPIILSGLVSIILILSIPKLNLPMTSSSVVVFSSSKFT